VAFHHKNYRWSKLPVITATTTITTTITITTTTNEGVQ
jgi:hypothetical protein